MKTSPIPSADSLFLRKKQPMGNTAWLAALLCVAIAIADAIAGLFAGIGYRLELWTYRDGLGALPYVFWLAVAICVISSLSIAAGAISRRRGAVVVGSLALIIAGITAYIPWNLRQAARTVPPIHDISTDTDNPPQFVRIGTMRKKTDHPALYDGPETAALQKKGYPDLAPILVNAPPARVFDAARQVLGAMGMEIIDAEPIQGRIEATDRSLLFGFEDDVVVRIVPAADGSTKVDVRSKSRVGRSDLGINAHRIREFSAGLRRKLTP
jgi:uncharacterized protein (DUF1499 family)